jgi:hypothetical protein
MASFFTGAASAYLRAFSKRRHGNFFIETELLPEKDRWQQKKDL